MLNPLGFSVTSINMRSSREGDAVHTVQGRPSGTGQATADHMCDAIACCFAACNRCLAAMARFKEAAPALLHRLQNAAVVNTGVQRMDISGRHASLACHTVCCIDTQDTQILVVTRSECGFRAR